MKTPTSCWLVILYGFVASWMLTPALQAQAQYTTLWNGPPTNFTHTVANGLVDQLTPGVAFDRGTSGGLYNSVTESGATTGSPADTEWAMGPLTNYLNPTFGACPLEAGNSPSHYIGTNFVVHLINENIYFSLTLTGWGGTGETFSYSRTTPVTPVIWTGPLIAFFHEVAGAADQLTPGVALDRGDTGGLYNSITEAYPTNYSPADTEWAFGDLTNYATLAFYPCPLEQYDHPPGFVGSNFVVHLINENIFLSLTLTEWGGAGQSGQTTFGYNRSTPAAATPPIPSVTLTNPLPGAVFAAPANLHLGASASVSSGSVTNVQFFANSTPLGEVGVPPFNLTSNLLGTGAYALTAVATAAGISATSAVVNIAVVIPVTINLTVPTVAAGKLSFDYTANAGLAYVIQSSSNLLNWTSLVTNTAAANSVVFTNGATSTGSAFYRVERLPNP